MGGRSSVRGSFVHIITLITLEQFEVDKSRSSYDVPFRSYDFDFGKKKLRLLNYHFEFGKKQKLRLLKLYYKSGRKYFGHTNSLLLRQTSYGRNFPPLCRRRASQKRFFRIWTCSKSAENRAASGLWVGGHRYAGILCMSKLIWV